MFDCSIRMLAVYEGYCIRVVCTGYSKDTRHSVKVSQYLLVCKLKIRSTLIVSPIFFDLELPMLLFYHTLSY